MSNVHPQRLQQRLIILSYPNWLTQRQDTTAFLIQFTSRPQTPGFAQPIGNCRSVTIPRSRFFRLDFMRSDNRFPPCLASEDA